MSSILIVEDEAFFRETIAGELSACGYEVISVENGSEALEELQRSPVDIVLLDLNLPDLPGLSILKEIKSRTEDVEVIVVTALSEVSTAVEAMRLGAYTYMVKPFDLEQLTLQIERALEAQRLRREVRELHRMKREVADWGLLGVSRKIQEIRELIWKISRTLRTPVLIQGESGTGKELVANAIHLNSDRAKGPLVKVNCSAIPETLLEAELFGHERGAFTDARELRKGLFELADGGTIFLDEISDMQRSVQPKLLRVLEEQTIRRIGGGRDIRINVRVIAATNRDLEGLVKEGRFREDLFYRLKVIEVTLPPLRERPEDILPLAYHFVKYCNLELGKQIRGFSPLAEEMLLNYAWPGNVRELKNVIERAAILADGDVLSPVLLPSQMRGKAIGAVGGNALRLPLDLSLEEVERRYLQSVLKDAKGNRSEAARRLGITRTTLRAKLHRYSLDS